MTTNCGLSPVRAHYCCGVFLNGVECLGSYISKSHCWSGFWMAGGKCQGSTWNPPVQSMQNPCRCSTWNHGTSFHQQMTRFSCKENLSGVFPVFPATLFPAAPFILGSSHRGTGNPPCRCGKLTTQQEHVHTRPAENVT